MYTQALAELYQSALCSGDLTANDLLNQWIHGPVYDQSGSPIPGDPIVIKVKNFKKDTDNSGGHTGVVYSADVLIRLCTSGCQ